MKNVNVVITKEDGKIEISLNKDHFLIETDVDERQHPVNPTYSELIDAYADSWAVYFQDYNAWSNIADAVSSRVQWLLGDETDMSNLKEFLDWAEKVVQESYPGNIRISEGLTFRLATEMLPWDGGPINMYHTDRKGMIVTGYDGRFGDRPVGLHVIFPERVDYDFVDHMPIYEIEGEQVRFDINMDLHRPSGWRWIYEQLLEYFYEDDLFVLVDEDDENKPISDRWSLKRTAKEIFKRLERRNIIF